MPVLINHTDADKLLLESLNNNCVKNDEAILEIKKILEGNHKTYKYILVNALLAKATNEEANPLTLQAGSKLVGAFDARSLCHKVLVPFERMHLHNALGGSNEPFLNKPARATELSKSNPVRGGYDTNILNSLLSVLESINTSEEAKLYLCCALHILKEYAEKIRQQSEIEVNYNPTLNDIFHFISEFSKPSFEGETSALVVTTLERLYYQSLKVDYKVKGHKVNQSGASSNEVGDIDIFKEGEFYYAIEVKDKAFNSHDLAHAFEKIISQGGVKGQFIFGQNATFNKEEIEHTLSTYSEKGFYTYFSNILAYSRLMLFKMQIADTDIFINELLKTSNEINSTQLVKNWILELARKMDWIS